VRTLRGVEHGLDRRGAVVVLVGGGSLTVTAGEVGVEGTIEVGGGGVKHGSGLMDDVE